MSVKPILFNTEMVRAILDGKKTCTRRIVKGAIPDDAMWGYTMFTPKGCVSCRGVYADEYGEKFFRLPYQQGDILYVRETWGTYSKNWWEADYFMYRADYPKGATTYTYSDGIVCDLPKWHPSIHMPKEAARIWLKVTDVRVERLQECGEGWCIDIEKEGIATTQDAILYISDDAFHDALRMEFQKTWDGTIKKSDIERYGWNANPWVWVIEFERCEKPKEEE